MQLPAARTCWPQLIMMGSSVPVVACRQLYTAGLSGTLPQHFPSSLEVLQLWANDIRGTIPANWSLPGALTLLDISQNSLSGSIPQGWQLPGGLTWLGLGNNGLTSSIPPQWALPDSITTLTVQCASLSPVFPLCICAFTRLFKV